MNINTQFKIFRKLSFFIYFIIFFGIIGLDRITKYWAICNPGEQSFTSFLTCGLTFNRGFSWGLLNSESFTTFAFVTSIIIGVTAALFYYIIKRHSLNYLVYGELCVLAGALSNIIDRFKYSGVIDFIVIHGKNWAWPAFNIADSFILFGVFLMFLSLEKNVGAVSKISNISNAQD